MITTIPTTLIKQQESTLDRTQNTLPSHTLEVKSCLLASTHSSLFPHLQPLLETQVSLVWIVVISVIAAALIGFLGFLLYRYKMASVGRGTAVVYSDGKQINASGAQNEPS